MFSRKRFFSILIIIFLSLSFLFINVKVLPVYATITTYRNDSFENFPTYWTVTTGGGGIFSKSSTTAYSGTYSAMCNSTLSLSQAYATNVSASTIGYHHTQIWTYLNSSFGVLGEGGYLNLMFDSTHSTYGEYLAFYYSTYWYLRSYNGATYDFVTNITLDSWVKWDIVYYPTVKKVSVYLDSVWKGNFTSMGSSSTLTTMYLGDTSTTTILGNQFVYYDLLIQDDSSESSIYPSPSYDLSKTGTNSTLTISNWLFYSYWYSSNTNVSGFIFSFNGSGSFVNDTWSSFPDINATWANVTKTISNNVGNIISWQVFANNSYGWTTLPLQYITITATITFYFNSNGILEKNGTSVSNSSSVTYNTLSPVLHLSGVSNSGFAFMNFTISGMLITDNPYNFTVQNSTSIWCNFENTSILSYSLGYSVGYSDGYNVGFSVGNSTGFSLGNSTGFISGNSTGYSLGYSVGYSIGYTDGLGNGTGTPYLVARFSLNNSAPYQNETLFYNGSLSSSSSNITSFLWNFGDGYTTTGNTTTHKYALDGIFLINLTVSSGSMFSTMLQNITVSATTLTITGLDGTFALLMILLTVCLFLCLFRIPLIGFVFSLFTVSFSAWALTDTLLPLYPMINVFIAVIGGICFYLNIQKFREYNTTKKNTSKLARRF